MNLHPAKHESRKRVKNHTATAIIKGNPSWITLFGGCHGSRSTTKWNFQKIHDTFDPLWKERIIGKKRVEEIGQAPVSIQ